MVFILRKSKLLSFLCWEFQLFWVLAKDAGGSSMNLSASICSQYSPPVLIPTIPSSNPWSASSSSSEMLGQVSRFLTRFLVSNLVRFFRLRRRLQVALNTARSNIGRRATPLFGVSRHSAGIDIPRWEWQFSALGFTIGRFVMSSGSHDVFDRTVERASSMPVRHWEQPRKRILVRYDWWGSWCDCDMIFNWFEEDRDLVLILVGFWSWSGSFPDVVLIPNWFWSWSGFDPSLVLIHARLGNCHRAKRRRWFWYWSWSGPGTDPSLVLVLILVWFWS